jgi:dihydroflavonol-4-reductase
MRAFVTGGTGFIGANVVRALLDEGHQVRALVRPASDRSNLGGLPIEIVEGDLDDKPSLTERIAGCEAVFHLAAHYSLWARDRAEIYRVNVDATSRLLAADLEALFLPLIKTRKDAENGEPGSGSVADESTVTNLNSLVSDYKKSKYLAEAAARAAIRDGLDVVIVNPSTPVGPYDIKPTPTGDIIRRFLQGRMPFYVHTGLNLIDVADVARGHLRAYERGKKGERYILGSRNLTLREMLEILSSITGLPAPRFAIPHAIPQLAAYVDEMILARFFGKQPELSVSAVRMSRKAMYYDAGKAVRELGLKQSPIEGALERAVDWFRKK